MEKKNFYEFLEQEARRDGIEKIVAGGVVTNAKGEILLLTRGPDEDCMPNIDELPSGNLEKGEDIHIGLLREVKEETGIEEKDLTIFGYIDYFDYKSGSGKNARQYNFAISTKTEKVRLSEHVAYKWQVPDQVSENKNVTAPVKRTIAIFCFNEQAKQRQQSKKKGIVAVTKSTTKQNGD